MGIRLRCCAPGGRGAPQGPRETLQRSRRLGAVGCMARPNVVLKSPTGTLRADGADVFRELRSHRSGQRHADTCRGLQFQTAKRPAVDHDEIARFDRTLASRQFGSGSSWRRNQGLTLSLGWIIRTATSRLDAGQAPPLGGDDLSWRLEGGPNGGPTASTPHREGREECGTIVNLYFTDTPPSRTPSIMRLGRDKKSRTFLRKRSNLSRHRLLLESFQLTRRCRAFSRSAHYRATRVDAWPHSLMAPGALSVRINDWDMNWQDQYRYAAPFLVAGRDHDRHEVHVRQIPRRTREIPIVLPRVSLGLAFVGTRMADVWSGAHGSRSIAACSSSKST